MVASEKIYLTNLLRSQKCVCYFIAFFTTICLQTRKFYIKINQLDDNHSLQLQYVEAIKHFRFYFPAINDGDDIIFEYQKIEFK